MRSVVVIAALGASLWAMVALGGQTSPPVVSAALTAHLKNDQMQVITSIRGLPLGVRDALGELIKGQYTDFAEPATPFLQTDPRRRLSLAACSADHHCIVYYERGGRTHTWHVAIFQWSPAATTLEFGGTAPGGLKTIEAVRSAVVSGAVKTAPVSW